MDEAAVEKALSFHELQSRPQRWSAWLQMLITGAFVLSLLAFVLAAAAFFHPRQDTEHMGVQPAISGSIADNNGQIASSHDPQNLSPDQDSEDKSSTHMEQQIQRRADQRRRTGGDGCSSHYDNSSNSTVVPSAHIVGSSREQNLPPPPSQGYAYTFISRNWSCNKKSHTTLLAFTRGGVSYDGNTGYLTVPVTGIYFLYSQVQLTVKDVSEGGSLIHRTVKDCTYCTHPKPLMESTVPYKNQGGLAPTYHGGLFHLEAGEAIAITVHHGLELRNPSSHFKYVDSFMGIHLVSKE